ncbi:hypothetical protein WDW37_02965 [Bdellovibrionota bacterium FG-1]
MKFLKIFWLAIVVIGLGACQSKRIAPDSPAVMPTPVQQQDKKEIPNSDPLPDSVPSAEPKAPVSAMELDVDGVLVFLKQVGDDHHWQAVDTFLEPVLSSDSHRTGVCLHDVDALRGACVTQFIYVYGGIEVVVDFELAPTVLSGRLVWDFPKSAVLLRPERLTKITEIAEAIAGGPVEVVSLFQQPEGSAAPLVRGLRVESNGVVSYQGEVKEHESLDRSIADRVPFSQNAVFTVPFSQLRARGSDGQAVACNEFYGSGPARDPLCWTVMNASLDRVLYPAYLSQAKVDIYLTVEVAGAEVQYRFEIGPEGGVRLIEAVRGPAVVQRPLQKD